MKDPEIGTSVCVELGLEVDFVGPESSYYGVAIGAAAGPEMHHVADVVLWRGSHDSCSALHTERPRVRRLD